MGEADRYSEYKKQNNPVFALGQKGNHVVTLLILNIVCFLLLMFIQVIANTSLVSNEVFNNKVVPWVALPSSFTEWLHKPWTIITYFICDYGDAVWRVVSNMIWLWVFGNILQDLSGNEKIIPAYIYGGLIGGLFYILAFTLIPSLKPFAGQSVLLGANTGVVGIAMATTALAPGFRFFRQLAGGVPIWILMALFMLINIAGASFNSAFSIAQIGAALSGFMYIWLYRKGINAGIWIENFVNRIFGFSTGKKKSVKDKIFYNTGRQKPFSKSSVISQERVDAILDKINYKGYSALTEEEKNILKRASEEEGLK